jgi:coenzyme F420-reducing hydrogenase delta subunit
VNGNGFEPTIVAFTCNWCSYAAADLAGTSRIHYPPNVRTIRVMCSGMVDPIFVLRALETGFDGVLIAGCHFGDCHYVSGNVKAQDRVETLRRAHTPGPIERSRWNGSPRPRAASRRDDREVRRPVE